MAHPEEPTLPEDTGQRKNKNINNVLHDISRFLLSEIQRRAFLSPRSVKQYKKVTAMDAKLEQLEATLNNINVFNAGKKREEAVALLRVLALMRLNRRVPVGTHGGVRGRLSIHESLLLDFTAFYAFFTLRAMISGSTQKKVNSPVANSFSSSPRMSTATRQVEWPRCRTRASAWISPSDWLRRK